jgi:hypothetical protein
VLQVFVLVGERPDERPLELPQIRVLGGRSVGVMVQSMSFCANPT